VVGKGVGGHVEYAPVFDILERDIIKKGD